MPRDSLPPVPQVRPRRVRIPSRRGGGAGDPYYGPVVFKVLERDELGRPCRLQLGFDDGVFSVEPGAEFFTGFIHAGAAEVKTKGNA